MGLENYNITNGEEYANVLIDNMRTIGDLPEDMFEYWSREIRIVCNRSFLKYIEGEQDSFLITDEDMEECFKEANRKLVGDTLAALVDKGMVNMSVGDDGEILYSINDKGENQLNNGGNK